MSKFMSAKVWQRSKDLAVNIYRITGKGKFSKDFGLRDQIQRAAVSTPCNIAEGEELSSDKQSNKYFYIAKGSSAEVLTQAVIAMEIGYIEKTIYEHLENECKVISGMLMKLIKARS
jgi:four helix bundle protein